MKIDDMVLQTLSMDPDDIWGIHNDACVRLTPVPTVKKVIFNEPATVILWKDGTKTVVRCAEGEKYDKFVGLAMCFLKKLAGTDYPRIRNEIRKYE